MRPRRRGEGGFICCFILASTLMGCMGAGLQSGQQSVTAETGHLPKSEPEAKRSGQSAVNAPARYGQAVSGRLQASPSTPPADLSPQQAAQAAATDIRPWRPLGRLFRFRERGPSEGIHLWRSPTDISLPGTDLANFPNSSYTLPQGGVYLESSPVGFYGSSDISSSQWNWEYLLRYGLTDDFEVRLFSNGLSVASGAVGFSPLAFDFKTHLWSKEWDHFNISIGLEGYVQTDNWLRSPAFDGPIQHSVNLLFDHELPLDISFSWNVGYVRQGDSAGNVVYLPSLQWAFQRNLTDDIAFFIQGYHNASALPRVPGADTPFPSNPQQEAIGLGGQWTVNNRIAIYGSYNWGLTRFTPAYNANVGMGVSF